MVMQQNVTFASISFQLNSSAVFFYVHPFVSIFPIIFQILKLQNHVMIKLLRKVYIYSLWNIHTLYTEFWSCSDINDIELDDVNFDKDDPKLLFMSDLWLRVVDLNNVKHFKKI